MNSTYVTPGLTPGQQIMIWFVIIALVALYWLPTFIAFNRDVANRGSVAVVNLFLGWTLIGWVAALAMACRDQKS